MNNYRINTGNFITSQLKGPFWSPYAQAIADHYPIQLPWYLTTSISIGNPPPALNIPRLVVMRPQQYDTLIFGLHSFQNPPVTLNGMMYLNITHKQTGIPWVAPSTIGYAPLNALAGTTFATVGASAILKLPETFFLPARTLLEIAWMPFNVNTPISVTLTFVGAQLINHSPGFTQPQTVKMPNGDVIRVGSRVPWLATVPYGAKSAPQFGQYLLNTLQQVIQLTPPAGCDVEVHDAYASFLDSTFEYNGNLNSLVAKISDTKDKETWMPKLAPVQAIFGSRLKTNPAAPFAIPHFLKTGRKITVVEQDNDTLNTVTRGTLTFRGVRICQY